MHNLDKGLDRTSGVPHPSCCPVCHAGGEYKKTEVAIAGGCIYICRACSGYFLFSKAAIDYNAYGWTERRQEHWDEDWRRGCKFAQAISKRLHEQWGYSIRSGLEIGCGSGFMGKGFESIGCSYTGIDVDAESIAFAQEKGLEVYRLLAEQLDSSTIADRRYDLILSSNVFEHVEDPVKTFQNVRALAKGIIVIIVPNANGLFQRLKANRFLLRLAQSVQKNTREIAYSIDGYWHNIAYSTRTLEHLAEMSSLEVIDIETIGTNDKTFGLVQPNPSFLYRMASGFAAMLGMDSGIILVARAGSVFCDDGSLGKEDCS